MNIDHLLPTPIEYAAHQFRALSQIREHDRQTIRKLRKKLNKKKPPVESPYLTAQQAAVYLNISYGTFRNHATEIKRTRHGRYTKEDLDRWAQNIKRK